MTAPHDTDLAEFVLPATAVRRRLSPSDTAGHPLLLPLAEAQDAVARLEATAATASSAVAGGLRARIAYQEAAGWLGACRR